MTSTKILSERLREEARWLGQGENSDLMAEAADGLDAKDKEIKKLRAEIFDLECELKESDRD